VDFTGIELLESRTVLSGNVTAIFTPAGDLRITGDGEGNAIIITAPPGNLLSVSGIAGTGTTVNHFNASNFLTPTPQWVPRNLIVNLAAGDDFVQIRNLGVFGDVIVTTAAGADTVLLRDLNILDDVTVSTGTGDDLVALVHTTITDRLSISTAAGTDYVGIHQCNHVNGPTTILAGADPDLFLLAGSFGATFNANLGSGDDAVGVLQLDQIGSVQSRIDLSTGNDQIYLSAAANAIGNVKLIGSGSADYLGCHPTAFWLLQIHPSLEQVVWSDPTVDPTLLYYGLSFITIYQSRGGNPADLSC
jgi:hypothetical protein